MILCPTRYRACPPAVGYWHGQRCDQVHRRPIPDIKENTRMAAVITQRMNLSESEWQIRVDLAAAFRLVHLFGWSDLLATHLSARVPGPDDQFLINPFGLL